MKLYAASIQRCPTLKLPSRSSAHVLVTGFPAGPWGTNCFLVAEREGTDCLIIDPGMGAVPDVQEALSKHRLTPVAVVLTHGHLDHTFSVTPLCDSADIPAYIHPGDRDMVADPAVGFSPDMFAAVRQITGGDLGWREPADVRLLHDGISLDLLGLPLTVRHAPGHTPGSTVFSVPETSDTPPLLFSGDLLFAGSIGRTDLPGGDSAAMMTSLATVLPTYADDTVVLPGHGPTTTMADERRTNPYLTGAARL